MGENDINGTITHSYFDTKSTATDGVGSGTIIVGLDKTTAELQEALAYGGIYVDWNVDVDDADSDATLDTGVDDPWDLGTDMQYPALKVDFDGNDDATAYEFGVQGRSAPPPPTITSDDPTLINITTLEQLNAMRYDLDGNGVASGGKDAAYAAAFLVTPSCPDGCMGYELRNDLDFEDATSYAGSRNEAWVAPGSGGILNTLGWQPIGGTFTAVFEGNGHTISNLYINRTTDNVGLFGTLGSGGEVRNLGDCRRKRNRERSRRRSCGAEQWYDKYVLCNGNCSRD